LAKLGLDGHDLGARYLARNLRDAGYEVIYTGLHATPAAVARAAMEEDVDVVGVSMLSGAHVPLCAELRRALDSEGLTDVPIVFGGVILPEDIAELKAAGAAEVFPSTEPAERFQEYFRRLAAGKAGQP
jgi:methylmalonyl-CoA mutase C-terminal domain/subunit